MPRGSAELTREAARGWAHGRIGFMPLLHRDCAPRHPPGTRSSRSAWGRWARRSDSMAVSGGSVGIMKRSARWRRAGLTWAEVLVATAAVAGTAVAAAPAG